MLPFEWHEFSNPEGLSPVTQVYGVCFDEQGRVLLLKQAGQPWNIPGGSPEAGETPSDTLKREVYEETTVHIGAHEMIGYQTPTEESPIYFQLRYGALIDRIDEQKPDPDKGAVHERKFVPIAEVMNYITFPQYEPMFEAAWQWYQKQKS
jgi:ADP-ribose pyrophosphatase YjhB (NUDIX family)